MEAEKVVASSGMAAEKEAKSHSFLWRLVGIIFSPGETFAEIGRAPRVLVPLLCLVLLGAGTRFVVSYRFGYENMIQKQIEMQVEMMTKFNAPEQSIKEAKERAEEQLQPEKIKWFMLRDMATSGIVFPLAALAAAGVFKLFSLIIAATNRFKGVFSVVSFAYLAIGILQLVVTSISVFLKNPEDINIINPIASNVGAILTMTDAGAPKFLTALASWIDFFGIWRITLLAIGCAAVTTKMKSGTASIPHISLYTVAALIMSLFASLVT